MSVICTGAAKITEVTKGPPTAWRVGKSSLWRARVLCGMAYTETRRRSSKSLEAWRGVAHSGVVCEASVPPPPPPPLRNLTSPADPQPLGSNPGPAALRPCGVQRCERERGAVTAYTRGSPMSVSYLSALPHPRLADGRRGLCLRGPRAHPRHAALLHACHQHASVGSMSCFSPFPP